MFIKNIFFLFEVIDSVKGIIEAKSANYLDELESMSSTWDGEIRLKTKYVYLCKSLNFWKLKYTYLKIFIQII